MKIVFVNRFYAPDHSATSQMLTDLAVGLAAGGSDAQVVTSRQRYDDPAALLVAREVIDGVTVHRVWTSAFGRSKLLGRAIDYVSFCITASVRLFRLIKSDDVVVAMTDPPLVSVPVGLVAWLRGARVVNWLQDIFPEIATALNVKFARGPGGRLLVRIRNRSLRSASTNVVLGRAMRQRVAALGIDGDRIELIPNWADGAMLRPQGPDTIPLRAEWGLDGKFVVGYSGNMGRVHEFRTILDAATALRMEPGISFLFIGGGAQAAMIGRAAEKRGLTNLSFKPYQARERLDQSLGVADVHLVTLRPEVEGLIVPSKFYGIAAVGRPTLFIGDPDGEIGTVVRDTECGICVRQGDVAGLVSAIATLRDDLALRTRMGRNARSIFEERYDKAIALGKWQILLRGSAKSMDQRGVA